MKRLHTAHVRQAQRFVRPPGEIELEVDLGTVEPRCPMRAERTGEPGLKACALSSGHAGDCQWEPVPPAEFDPKEKNEMNRNTWEWHGRPGHFICAYQCCFRLHTVVGNFRISTVGCYHPASDETGEPHAIGAGRLYETMVFAADKEPLHELDFAAYNTDEDAERGHIAMCEKYEAAQRFDPLRPAEDRSEAEQDRYAEFGQDARDDARIDYESEEL